MKTIQETLNNIITDLENTIEQQNLPSHTLIRQLDQLYQQQLKIISKSIEANSETYKNCLNEINEAQKACKEAVSSTEKLEKHLDKTISALTKLLKLVV